MPTDKKKCECKPKPKGPTKLQLFLSKKKPPAKKPLEGGIQDELRSGTKKADTERNTQQYRQSIDKNYKPVDEADFSEFQDRFNRAGFHVGANEKNRVTVRHKKDGSIWAFRFDNKPINATTFKKVLKDFATRVSDEEETTESEAADEETTEVEEEREPPQEEKRSKKRPGGANEQALRDAVLRIKRSELEQLEESQLENYMDILTEDAESNANPKIKKQVKEIESILQKRKEVENTSPGNPPKKPLFDEPVSPPRIRRALNETELAGQELAISVEKIDEFIKAFRAQNPNLTDRQQQLITTTQKLKTEALQAKPEEIEEALSKMNAAIISLNNAYPHLKRGGAGQLSFDKAESPSPRRKAKLNTPSLQSSAEKSVEEKIERLKRKVETAREDLARKNKKVTLYEKAAKRKGTEGKSGGKKLKEAEDDASAALTKLTEAELELQSAEQTKSATPFSDMFKEIEEAINLSKTEALQQEEEKVNQTGPPRSSRDVNVEEQEKEDIEAQAIADSIIQAKEDAKKQKAAEEKAARENFKKGFENLQKSLEEIEKENLPDELKKQIERQERVIRGEIERIQIGVLRNKKISYKNVEENVKEILKNVPATEKKSVPEATEDQMPGKIKRNLLKSQYAKSGNPPEPAKASEPAIVPGIVEQMAKEQSQQLEEQIRKIVEENNPEKVREIPRFFKKAELHKDGYVAGLQKLLGQVSESYLGASESQVLDVFTSLENKEKLEEEIRDADNKIKKLEKQEEQMGFLTPTRTKLNIAEATTVERTRKQKAEQSLKIVNKSLKEAREKASGEASTTETNVPTTQRETKLDSTINRKGEIGGKVINKADPDAEEKARRQAIRAAMINPDNSNLAFIHKVLYNPHEVTDAEYNSLPNIAQEYVDEKIGGSSTSIVSGTSAEGEGEDPISRATVAAAAGAPGGDDGDDSTDFESADEGEPEDTSKPPKRPATPEPAKRTPTPPPTATPAPTTTPPPSTPPPVRTPTPPPDSTATPAAEPPATPVEPTPRSENNRNFISSFFRAPTELLGNLGATVGNAAKSALTVLSGPNPLLEDDSTESETTPTATPSVSTAAARSDSAAAPSRSGAPGGGGGGSNASAAPTGAPATVRSGDQRTRGTSTAQPGPTSAAYAGMSASQRFYEMVKYVPADVRSTGAVGADNKPYKNLRAELIGRFEALTQDESNRIALGLEDGPKVLQVTPRYKAPPGYKMSTRGTPKFDNPYLERRGIRGGYVVANDVSGGMVVPNDVSGGMVVPNDVTGGMVVPNDVTGGGRKLTGRQLRALHRHAPHHSEEHMKHMRKRMREGASLTEAHKDALQLVGGKVIPNDVTGAGHCGEIRGGYVVANDISGGGAPSIFAM